MVLGTPDLDAIDAAAKQVEQQIGLPVNATVMTREEWDGERSGFVAHVKAVARVPILLDPEAD